jgi:hypothetical protein
MFAFRGKPDMTIALTLRRQNAPDQIADNPAPLPSAAAGALLAGIFLGNDIHDFSGCRID